MLDVLLPPPQKIYHFNPSIDGLRFEWHSEGKKLYLVTFDGKDNIGTLIGENIEDHGSAINGVHMWLRGYKWAKQEDMINGR